MIYQNPTFLMLLLSFLCAANSFVEPNIFNQPIYPQISSSNLGFKITANDGYPPYNNGHLSNFFTIALTRDASKEDQISYFGVVGLGTPRKLFKMVFDTNSDDTWILYKMFSKNSGGYTKDKSSTAQKIDDGRFKEYKFKQTSTTFDGSKYKDRMELIQDSYDGETEVSSISYFNQDFLGVKEIKNEGKLKYNRGAEVGFVSLAPGNSSSFGLKPFLESFNQALPKSKPIFSFWFNPDSLSRRGAKLILGGVNSKLYHGQINYHRTNKNTKWQLPLSHVKVNNLVKSCVKNCNAILDTSQHYLLAPKEDIEQIFDILGVPYKGKSTVHYVQCDRMFPTIDFVIEGIPYRITKEHYINKRIKNGVLTKECYVGIKENKRNDWILGTNFLSAYYTVFNQETFNRQIGFATPAS